MTSTPNRIWLFRIISLGALTLVTAWLLQVVDARTIAKMDSMPAAAFIDYERNHVHGHGYWAMYLGALIIGAMFFGAVELLSQALRNITQDRGNA